MVYFVPRKHECPKCKFTMEYSKHHHPYGTPVLDIGPICPKCYGNWLKDNFPIMEVNNEME